MGDHLLLERYRWFHHQVKTGQYPNATSLAARFETSPRTAKRDIARMVERLGAPLDYDSQNRSHQGFPGSVELHRGNPTHWY